MANSIFNNLKQIKLQQIKANPNQPRKYFDDESLKELSDSIKKCGIINPITVCKKDGIYQIIAGERRYRASRLAGLKEIPCLIVNNDAEMTSLIAIIENVQRYDLNFVEEAISYSKLIKDFGFKQEEIASKIGKTQSAVANKIRVLKLGDELLRKLLIHNLTERHARALLKVPEVAREEVLEYIVINSLNVLKSEEFIEMLISKSKEENKDQIKKKKYAKICADVKFFINSINKTVDSMNSAGVSAKINKKRTDNSVVYTIVIPI